MTRECNVPEPRNDASIPTTACLASWYNSSYTRVVKTAISIPDPLFYAAERAAKRQKVSRSRFYAKAVAAYLKSQGEKGIKEALDAVYASEPSEPDPFLAVAAYHVLSKENLKTQEAKGVKEALDAIYATEDSSLDPVIARIQSLSIGREEW